MKRDKFTDYMWLKSKELYREMPWREQPAFYNVLVSEIMLQQTQVARALVKYTEFMKAFPTVEKLAQATLADVLRAWQGLGYNRRAKFLHQAAKLIVQYGQPATRADCIKLPGVGENTAGAIIAYVYNQPELYIETNIRTVYLHHFFEGQSGISDTALREKLAETIDRDRPREFYWALMDYGSWLKRNGVRNIASSRHHTPQSPLLGSVREVRGQILRALLNGRTDESALQSLILADERFSKARDGLIADGLITRTNDQLELTN